jgi:hypothetical protein
MLFAQNSLEFTDDVCDLADEGLRLEDDKVEHVVKDDDPDLAAEGQGKSLL